MYTLISNLVMFNPAESVVVKTSVADLAVGHLESLGYNLVISQHDSYLEAFNIKKEIDCRLVGAAKLTNTYKFEQIISKLEESSGGKPNAYVWENFIFGYNIASSSILNLIEQADSAGAIIQRDVENIEAYNDFSGDCAVVRIDLSLIPEFDVDDFLGKQNSASFIDYVISEYYKYDKTLVLKSFEKERYLLHNSIYYFKGSSYKEEVPKAFDFNDNKFFNSMIGSLVNMYKPYSFQGND